MTLTIRQPFPADPVRGAQSPPAAPTPVKRPRLVGVDAARGVALLGMITLHALYEYTADDRPTWSFTLFSGRAAAAFAVLAGVGFAFATGRRRVRLSAGRATVATLAARALAIGAIGLALGHVDSVLGAVILAYLGMAFLLVIPLVFLPTRAVAVIGVAMATVMPVLSHVLQPHLPAPDLVNPTFADLAHPVLLISELSITGIYPALLWLAYLSAGLVIGRLDLTRTRVAVALLATGTVLAVAASAVSSLLLNRFGGLARIWAAQPRSGLTVAETTHLLTLDGDGTAPTSTWWWLAINSRHTGTPFDLLSTTGIAIALLGVMLLAGHVTRPALRRLNTIVQTPLAAVGSMTLTFYAAHVVFINSDFDTYDATTGCLVQLVAVLLIGLAWRSTVGRGPLEGLVAALATRARRWATSPWPRPLWWPSATVEPSVAGPATAGPTAVPRPGPMGVTSLRDLLAAENVPGTGRASGESGTPARGPDETTVRLPAPGGPRCGRHGIRRHGGAKHRTDNDGRREWWTGDAY